MGDVFIIHNMVI